MADLAANVLALIERIMQRVETTQQNRKEWQELGQYLTVLAGVLNGQYLTVLNLNQLPRSEMLRRPGTRDALHAMEGTIRQAYEIVRSSEKRSGFSRFFAREEAREEARQLREVKERIQSYLSLYPVISHDHLTEEVADLAEEVSWFHLSVIGAILIVGVYKCMHLLLSRS